MSNECKPVENECLTKLTEDVFLWPTCPKWAQYVAVDENGTARYHELKPKVYPHGWGGDGYVEYIKDYKFDASDWLNSVIEHPQAKTLPDWCKIGGYVYLTDGRYFRIEERHDAGFQLSGGVFLPYSDIGTKAVQARGHLYNKEEMAELVGQVVQIRDISRCLVTECWLSHREVKISDGWIGPKELARAWNYLDGEPCARLEHLNEKGEWVE